MVRARLELLFSVLAWNNLSSCIYLPFRVCLVVRTAPWMYCRGSSLRHPGILLGSSAASPLPPLTAPRVKLVGILCLRPHRRIQDPHRLLLFATAGTLRSVTRSQARRDPAPRINLIFVLVYQITVEVCCRKAAFLKFYSQLSM